MIPSVEPDELVYLQQITNGLPEDKLRLFVSIYNGKRKNADVILLCCLLGFVCCAGVQRALADAEKLGGFLDIHCRIIRAQSTTLYHTPNFNVVSSGSKIPYEDAEPMPAAHSSRHCLDGFDNGRNAFATFHRSS